LEGWTGVAAVKNVDHDATEVLTSHRMNGRFSVGPAIADNLSWTGWARAYRLDPSNERAEILARMVDYGGGDLGPCMTAFSNGLGGRVVVAGYYPWTFVHNLSKSTQLKAVCTWLSDDRLPVVAESFAKVVIWCRAGTAGQKAFVVLNASLDAIHDLRVRVFTDEVQFTHLSESGQRRELAGARLSAPQGHVRVVVPRS
jgi:hypothetical protein